MQGYELLAWVIQAGCGNRLSNICECGPWANVWACEDSGHISRIVYTVSR